MEEIKLLLSKAHAEFRRQRSGELGDNLRAQGIDYKIVWGLESYKLKEIAENLRAELSETETMALASALWEEDVRESKMLATRLYPTGKMTQALAEAWSGAVRYTELADQLCMNLLSRTDFAEALVRDWMKASSTDMQKYMGLQIALRRDFVVPEAAALAQDESLPLCVRTAALKLAQ